jgi:hypothetical protein
MERSELDSVIDKAWERARNVPGYLAELEFRALGVLAFSAPRGGVIVEIGSFKGKSTVGLATVAKHFGLGPVVSIDPHTSPCETDPDLGDKSTSFDDFMSTLHTAQLTEQVEVHRAFSREVANGWERKIAMLWIDGDHTYAGTKEDFDLFTPFLMDGATIALHDTLNKKFEGPMRVFVEDILRSESFGAAGFSRSVGWSQYRPQDGKRFCEERERLARRAARLIPYVSNGRQPQGVAKMKFTMLRNFVPHLALPTLSALKSV